ncbi:GNAT family N-acetyltransferase [Roseicella aquatilis]|uniref:N-acetyltransferase n=1 Tax=Roseicella aquatilis TaxID=2527868 RepID=A0A4R4DIT8_9PROT|nr:GNAT family N-acetyltransferase [Roseicella aquatilis]TCZ61091.1 N-acetyltransferase [Roseicella aquatilis]
MPEGSPGAGAPRTVETARLLLRPFEPADVAAYAAIRATPEVMRHMPGGAARAAAARDHGLRVLGLRRLDGTVRSSHRAGQIVRWKVAR